MNVLTIRRMAFRDELTHEINRGVILSSDDDKTFTLVDFRVDDKELIRRLLAISNNATLEEMFYFVEMGKWSVRVDDKTYTYADIRDVVEMGNTGRSDKNGKQESEPLTDEDVVGRTPPPVPCNEVPLDEPKPCSLSPAQEHLGAVPYIEVNQEITSGHEMTP